MLVCVLVSCMLVVLMVVAFWPLAPCHVRHSCAAACSATVDLQCGHCAHKFHTRSVRAEPSSATAQDRGCIT